MHECQTSDGRIRSECKNDHDNVLFGWQADGPASEHKIRRQY